MCQVDRHELSIMLHSIFGFINPETGMASFQGYNKKQFKELLFKRNLLSVDYNGEFLRNQTCRCCQKLTHRIFTL